MRVVFACSPNWYSDLVMSDLREKTKFIQYESKITEFPDQYNLGISFLYPYKIPKEELDKATWVNFHPGPLPDFGGRNLAYHAIMNDAKEFGGTLHYMDEGFDTGPIIEVERFKITKGMTAHDLVWGSYACLWNLYKKYIKRILKQEKLVTYTSPITYYKQSSISNYIDITPEQEKLIRALTCNNHRAKVTVGKRKYRMEPDENLL